MKYILLAAFVTLGLASRAQQVFHDKSAEPRQVDHFHAIDVSSAIELQLTQGSEDQVAVSAEDKDNIANIHTEVKNGVLRIWYKSQKWLKNNGRMRVYVAAKSLDGIEASGASEVNINGTLTSNALSVKLSGASDMHGEIRVTHLDLDLSGASDLKINGSATDLKVEASGASQLKAYDFIADNCLINASGASSVNLTANKVINAEASGASSISYKGSGQEGKIKSTGASSVSRKG